MSKKEDSKEAAKKRKSGWGNQAISPETRPANSFGNKTPPNPPPKEK